MNLIVRFFKSENISETHKGRFQTRTGLGECHQNADLRVMLPLNNLVGHFFMEMKSIKS